MTLFIEPGKPITHSPLTKLGAGAQGIVTGLRDYPAVCLKFFLQPSAELDRRVRGLLRLRPSEWGSDPEHLIAWPLWRLTDEDGLVRAVVLPRFDGSALYALFDPVQRLEILARPTWATCLQAALRISRMFRQLHRVNVLVGDVSPNNLLFDREGRIALIDCDSVQFTDDWTQELFPAAVATREYSSPEALRNPADPLAPAHDLFGLAILVCQLLMDGDHPFEGVPVSGPDRGIAGNILAGNNALFRPERLVPVPHRLDRTMLPAAVEELAYRALILGHTEPQLRPTAEDWEEALHGVLNDLLGCTRNGNHFHPAEFGRCVWCARQDAGLGDHFPARAPFSHRPDRPADFEAQAPARAAMLSPRSKRRSA